MARETYEELIEKIEKIAERPSKVKPGWRDYLPRLTSKKGFIATMIFGAGLATSTISGKVFVDRMNTIIERASEISDMPYKNLDKALERKSQSHEIIYDRTLDYASLGVIGGLGLAVGGAILGTYRPYGQWALKS